MATKSLSPKAFVKVAGGPKAGGAWLVYGFDEYIKSETTRMASRAFIGASDPRFSITHLFGGQTDSREILQCTQSVPMLGDKSAVIVHELSKLAPACKTRLAGELGKIGDTCLLICQGPAEPDKRTRMYQWFMDSGKDVLCDPLTMVQAEAFASRRFEELGTKAGAEALSRLLALTGPDAGRIARETEKLALFAQGEVTASHVDTVAGLQVGCTPEDLVASLVLGQVEEALSQARRMLASGIDAVSLVGRLSGYFFDLRRAATSRARQSGALAGLLRMPRSTAEQLLAWLSACREDRLDLVVQHLATADRLVRSGKSDPDMVCDQLVLRVAHALKKRAAVAA